MGGSRSGGSAVKAAARLSRRAQSVRCRRSRRKHVFFVRVLQCERSRVNSRAKGAARGHVTRGVASRHDRVESARIRRETSRSWRRECKSSAPSFAVHPREYSPSVSRDSASRDSVGRLDLTPTPVIPLCSSDE